MSIEVSGRRARRALSLDEVQLLLTRLRKLCAVTEFQVALKDLRARGWGAFKKRKAVAKLIAMVWKKELIRAGFRINSHGFPDLLATVGVHLEQPEIRMVAQEIETNLLFRPGDLFKPAVPSTPPQEEGNELNVPHNSQSQSALAASSAECRSSSAGSTEHVGTKLAHVAEDAGTDEHSSSLVSGRSSADAENLGYGSRRMSLDEARKMLIAFRNAVTDKEMQRTFDNLEKQSPSILERGRRILLAPVWDPVMTQHGFQVTSDGYAEMAHGIRSHGSDKFVRETAHQIERYCRLRPGLFFKIPEDCIERPAETAPPAEPAPLPSAEVEVLVRHSVYAEQQIRVMVPANATYLQLKEAIAALTGRRDIVSRGRLIWKKGAVFAAHRDHDRISATTEILALGADLSMSESAAAKAHSPPASNDTIEETLPGRQGETKKSV